MKVILVFLILIAFFSHFLYRMRKYTDLLEDVYIRTLHYVDCEKYNNHELVVVLLFKKVTIQNYIKESFYNQHVKVLENSIFYDKKRS